MRTDTARAPDPTEDLAELSTADALPALVAQATRHFANLRRLSRQSFPQAGASLAPFLGTVEVLLTQLARPPLRPGEDPAALAQPLEAAQEALVHLDALMEAFSMRPVAR